MDYNSGPYTVQFDAGVTRVSLNVSINNDNILEGDETFNLNIDSSSLPISVIADDPGQTTVTILANDGNHYVLTKAPCMEGKMHQAHHKKHLAKWFHLTKIVTSTTVTIGYCY